MNNPDYVMYFEICSPTLNAMNLRTSLLLNIIIIIIIDVVDIVVVYYCY